MVDGKLTSVMAAVLHFASTGRDPYTYCADDRMRQERDAAVEELRLLHFIDAEGTPTTAGKAALNGWRIATREEEQRAKHGRADRL